MTYHDHLKKTQELRDEITRLKVHRVSGDEVIKYLLESGEGLIIAARILIEARLEGESKSNQSRTPPAAEVA